MISHSCPLCSQIITPVAYPNDLDDDFPNGTDFYHCDHCSLSFHLIDSHLVRFQYNPDKHRITARFYITFHQPFLTCQLIFHDINKNIDFPITQTIADIPNSINKAKELFDTLAIFV